MTRSVILQDYTFDINDRLNNNVNWDVAVRDVGLQIGQAKYYFDSSDAAIFGPVDPVKRTPIPIPPSLLPAAFTAIDHRLCDPVHPHPVVVRVTGSDGIFGDHKVLITGMAPGNDYFINDPADRHTLLSQYGQFNVVGFVADPPDNMSGFDVTVGTNADVSVQDSAGQITGFDSSSGQYLSAIPQSTHVIDATDDEETGAPPIGSMHLVNIFQPSNGSYQVAVTAIQPGPYTLNLNTYSTDGSAQPPLSIGGIAGVGSSSTFQVQFSGSVGASPSLTRVATFDSTLADISNSLQLGLIDSAGVANSLSSKIQAAAAAQAQGQTQTIRNILTAFKNEVSAQTTKHVNGIAPQVLQEDADSLDSQIQH
jgi:hypothetical protein